MSVYQAIAKVQSELAKTGISKERKASGGGANYNFRGIDDVYANLAPLLSEHGLCIIPRMISRECAERRSRYGAALFYVTVHAEFDFVSAVDGSKHTAATFGEAMDISDKATNKAMSAAYKYAAFMTFCIPVDGDNDTENAHHEVAPSHPARIDDAQYAELSTLLQQSRLNSGEFLEKLSINSLPELPASRFAAVSKRLREIIHENAQQKEAA